MVFFDTLKAPKLKNVKRTAPDLTPSGLWKKCNECSELLQVSKLEDNNNVCPSCGHHFRISVDQRIALLIDENTFTPTDIDLQSLDPLSFFDQKKYSDRLVQSQKTTGHNDSCVIGTGLVESMKVSIGVMNFQFMGGSMGVVTGEKITRVFDRAFEEKIPAIIVSCSGGARMQEGILSLMQMAKTSASRQRLLHAGIPFISIITDPTTGGVAASFAMLGDVIIAEPQALIGFAGPRVIEQTMRQSLPKGFQRSEFLRDHGFVDRVVKRSQLKKEVGFFLNALYPARQI